MPHPADARPIGMTTAARTFARWATILVAVYVLLDVVIGLLPPHYSIVSAPESDYGVGPFALLMDVNFLVRGASAALLVLALARSRRVSGRHVGLVAFSLWGLGSALLAFFPTDLAGYAATAHGTVHLTAAGIAFLAAAIGMSALGRSASGGEEASPAMGVGRVITWCAWVLLALLFLALGRGPHGFGALDGLIERLYLASVLLWTALVARGLARGTAGSVATT